MRSVPWRVIALACAAVVVAFTAFAGVHLLSPGPSAPPTPSGLNLQPEPGRVDAQWQPVDGADHYLLLRGDQVVYAGSEPRGRDETATKGRHTYRVQASRRGVPSPMSEPVTVETQEGWGAAAPLVNLLPKLLPAAPKVDGPWRKLHCNWQIRPGRNEMGPAEHGAGVVGMRYRLICGASLEVALHAMWFFSKDAVDGYMSRVTTDSEALRWNHGSAFWYAAKNEGYLKFDDPKLSLIVVGVGRTDRKTTRADFLALANELPI
ncbi:hypothetical protein GOARA_056_00630 [Gordonia araii NBRC 100433]|uniref:Fibronectin type-III domain-containing protein n=1 Tax=Gordonia araii NBRC 100433 TaxID=1073574 RepID=G7H391_9ACTN|nr:hypothetical protein [Gordonia araii]NNG96434.1 hypothetical protein [Gordonia araii NBRC 100433]GAB10316.1 hypothetical protein GOARA_056_00630 [Gordonia araii NBRC 100433]